MKTYFSKYLLCKEFFIENNILYNMLFFMIKRPRGKFKKKKKDRIEYKNVSYRLPKHLLSALNRHVDKDNSACGLVAQILEWALEDMEALK